MNAVVIILNIILILSWICKTYLHVTLGKKYGKEFSYGFFTSIELFFFYKGDVSKEDIFKKRLIKSLWQIFLVTLIIMLLIKFIYFK